MSSVVTKLGSGSKRSVSRSRRHSRVRKKVTGTTARPRLVVFRSARHIEVQVVDDSVGTVHDYTATAVAGFAQDQAQVDAVISSHLDKWQLDRLPAVDRAILRLATWELFNATDVDTVVIVDEAVQLAKELSTDNSPAFVNGVLAKIAELAPQVRSAAAAQPQEAVED